MILIRHTVNGETQAVESTDGYDLAEWEVLDTDAPNLAITRQRWNNTIRALEPIPLTPAEETEEALEGDGRWQAMKEASPADVEAWLTTHVNSLADARRVLKVLILAVQRLARTR